MEKKIIETITRQIEKTASPKAKKVLKKSRGKYIGEDVTLGGFISDIRRIATKYLEKLSLDDLDFFIQNRIHEYRSFALLVAMEKFLYAEEEERKEIFDWYLKNIKYINSWDLIDLSAGKIVGGYLWDKDKSVLYDMVKNGTMWEQRIAVVATSVFIKGHEYQETLDFAKMLMNSRDILVLRACGWMLREVGKRDITVLTNFLDENAERMPSIMLKYSIEKLGKEERTKYRSVNAKFWGYK
jgi:3-methyladenine DNA glycosylase AlkD